MRSRLTTVVGNVASLVAGVVMRPVHRARAIDRRLLASEEAERRRIARVLHEDVGQLLTAVRLDLQRLDAVEPAARAPIIADSIGLVDQAMDTIRDLSVSLRPSVLDDLGLAAAVDWLLQRQAERAGYRGTLDDRLGETSIPDPVATAAYHVLREALTNIARHARAEQVWVELRSNHRFMSMTVRDDGAGFVVQEAQRRAERGTSLGILDMRETVARAGGTLTISSIPGDGASVTAVFPVDGHA